MSFLCYNCFQESQTSAAPCPRCGWNPAADEGRFPYALPCGTALGGRYITGRVLGVGGFGITYLAQDHKTKERVAIKEFFPDTMVSRGGANTVLPFTGQRENDFAYGKAAFLDEAKALSQFNGNPNIVHVYSYFEENGTAYFSMEYVEGESLFDYMNDYGGKLSWEKAEQMLFPVMNALSEVHSKGMIHRDVKPDNIILSRDGSVKLLDFGSARYSMGEKSRSLDVILTHGFAPREQYSRHGRQGAYTDVYALAATFYYAITGRKPPDAIDRMDEDTLVAPSTLGVRVTAAQEDALLKALSVEPQDRFQNMAAFRNALTGASEPIPDPAPTPDPVKEMTMPKWQFLKLHIPKWLIPVGTTVLCAGIILAMMLSGGTKDILSSIQSTPPVTTAQTAHPVRESLSPTPAPARTPSPAPTPVLSYTIKASANQGGSISPAGTLECSSGEKVDFKIRADSGYVIDSVLIDGVSQQISDSYRMVADKNRTIAVKFRRAVKYEAVRADISWTDAERAAEARGGHLATASSDEEMYTLFQYAMDNNLQVCMIGAYIDHSEKTYYWLTGEKYEILYRFPGWFPGEPNNSGGNEDYVAIMYKKSEDSWGCCDIPDDAYKVYTGREIVGYIIEWDT